MKRLKAIFFLFTFSLSIAGYTFELHYCKGVVTDISFFGNADCVCTDMTSHKVELKCKKQCHSEELIDYKMSSENPHSNLSKNDCCKTEKLTFLSPGIKAHSNVETSVFIQFVSLLNPFFFSEFYPEKIIPQVDYSPPILTKNFQVLTQTFLI